MQETSEWIIVCGGLFLLALVVAVFGYFWAGDIDALGGGFLIMATIAAVLWFKAKQAKL